MGDQTRIGWWEWVVLPGLHDQPLRAKCDTGASLSALHAEDLEIVAVGEVKLARFRVEAGGPLIELTVTAMRQIKSSNGETQVRPCVLCPVQLGDQVIAIECTLTDRMPMTYPMLLGRSALAGRFLVDSSAGHVFRKPRARRVK